MSSTVRTRRVFLVMAGTGAFTVALAACGAQAVSATVSANTAAAPTTAAAATATSSATAASSQAAASAPTPATAVKVGATEIVWLVRGDVVENKGQQQVFEPAIKAQYPQITVNRVVVPNTSGTYNAKILTLAAAKQGLDLWGFGQNYMDFWAEGMAQNLDSYISADKWDIASYFLPGLSDIYNVHGHHYGLPQDTTYGSVLVYNKDMFDKAGLKYPPVDWEDPSWTMDQMLENAKKLSTKTGAPDATFGINIGLQKQTDLSFLWGDSSWLPEHYTNFIAQKTNFGNAGNIAGHQFVHDLIYTDKVHPDPAALQGMNQLGDAFHTGRVGMNLDGGWLYWTTRNITAFKVGFAASPTAKTNKLVNYDDQWIMASWSANKDAVWDVMRVLTSVEPATNYSVLTGSPPTPVGSTGPWIKQVAQFTGQSVDDLTKVTSGALVKTRTQESPDHLFLQWPKISTAYTNQIAALWNDGGATAAKVIPTMASNLDTIVLGIYNQFKPTLPTA